MSMKDEDGVREILNLCLWRAKEESIQEAKETADLILMRICTNVEYKPTLLR